MPPAWPLVHPQKHNNDRLDPYQLIPELPADTNLSALFERKAPHPSSIPAIANPQEYFEYIPALIAPHLYLQSSE